MAISKKDITVSFPGGKRVDAHYGDRTVQTDQSVKNGGAGAAPEPFDLFFVSMATCVGIYVLEFCTTRNLDTEGLDVHLYSEFNPDEKRYPLISIDVKLPNGFPEKYKKAIWRTANLCSVKKHVLNPPDFDITLDGEQP
ncbi:MAG: OsmC family protein [Verrucomicrobiota bacterium]|nr:OsmC family protein [Verrucomicrobiota bacterium]